MTMGDSKNILGDLGTHFNKSVVMQCQGSCYFESVVSPLEAKLSIAARQPISISRAHLMASVLLFRLVGLVEGGKGIITHFETKNGKVDILSTGDPFLMNVLINSSSLRLLGPKSQSYIYKENAVIQKLNDKVGEIIYSLLKSRPFKKYKNQDEADADKYRILKQHLHYFAIELKRILEQSGLEESEPIKNINLSFNKKILEFESSDYLDLEIEKKQKISCLKIVEQFGEKYFRKLENKILKKILRIPQRKSTLFF
jgi:hypothetical protein